MPRQRFTPEPPLLTFRVRLPGAGRGRGQGVWRELELAANQTLEDLGEAIPLAFGFTDPHLWAFFLSGKAWDRATEYALRPSTGFLGGAQARAAGRVRLRDVPYPGGDGPREFLYLFDFGDEWRFRVKLVRVTPTLTPGEPYPRLVASHGQAPPQYAPLEGADDG
jgi:Plasmid pRiA4b ORF-3-like protein